MIIIFTSNNDNGFEDRLQDKNNKDNNDQEKIMRAGTTMLQQQWSFATITDLKTTDRKQPLLMTARDLKTGCKIRTTKTIMINEKTLMKAGTTML